MNYIVLHWAYGHGSVPAIINKMTQECVALAKKGDVWRAYDEIDGEKQWEIANPKHVMNALRDPDNRIINWGNHIFSDDSLFDLNRPSAIALASNKRESRRVLQNAGVSVPRTHFLNNVYVKDTEGINFPVIGRPSSHHAGREFHIFNSGLELAAYLHGRDLSQWYISEVFPKTHEYRLHVAHGKVLAMYEKPLVPGEIRGNFSVNHESWRVLRWSEYSATMSLQAIRAVEELGLDYGAVDLMYSADTNAVAIAEVNTSPQTTWEYLSGKYAAYFDWVIRHDFPDHFQVEGTSVFYNNILRS